MKKEMLNRKKTLDVEWLMDDYNESSSKFWLEWADGGNDFAVTIRPRPGFTGGQSVIAVLRKLNRMAVKLHLVTRLYPYTDLTVVLYSRRDFHRFKELMKYAEGKRLAKTAANNNGRITESFMQFYSNFLGQEEHEFCCAHCPKNAHMQSGWDYRHPCGQYGCWVTASCSCEG